MVHHIGAFSPSKQRQLALAGGGGGLGLKTPTPHKRIATRVAFESSCAPFHERSLPSYFPTFPPLPEECEW